MQNKKCLAETATERDDSPKVPHLFRAIAVMLMLGLLIVYIGHGLLPVISPWEFLIAYLTGTAIVFLVVGLSLLGRWVARQR